MAEQYQFVKAVANRLGYSDTGGLLYSGDATKSGTRTQLLRRAAENVGVNAVYFAGDRPLVYFAERPDLDAKTCWKLQRAAWNDCRVPLLFVVARNRISIYDAYAAPANSAEDVDAEGRLVQTLDILSAELELFQRQRVESGQLWRQFPSNFDLQTRCDQTPLKNLGATQQALLKQNLPNSVVYSLLPRLILILYLDHRGVLSSSYYQRFGGNTLFDILRRKRTTYQLFSDLQDRFNGDLFPVNEEESRKVTDQHVATLGEFLSGSEMDSGQRSLWPLYDFSIIPIQLVSAIYEFFLRHPDRPGKLGVGTVYTPQELVELLVNEVLPWPQHQAPQSTEAQLPKVIDPACGSGIFLVEAYRRIVEMWCARHPTVRPSARDLRTILITCIHGIEKEVSARQVTAFSLYLAMLDYVEPKHIWTTVKFPSLTSPNDQGKENIELGDAFAKGEDGSYDIVLGNPPWKRNFITASAKSYCASRNQPIAAEIAHAFLWRSLDLAKPTGQVAVLAPAKWLFNQEGPDQKFRRAFLKRAHIETIVNLSAVRRDVFADAVGPATAVIFRPQPHAKTSSTVMYCTPKQDKRRVLPLMIDGADVKWIARKEVESRDDIWKPLMWASWRDLLLVRRLKALGESLGNLLEQRGSHVGHGFQPFDENRNKAKGVRAITDRALAAMPHVEASQITRYAISNDALLPQFSSAAFVRRGRVEAYTAPHILIKESVPGGRLVAAFLSTNCTFRDTITGVADRDSRFLKAFTAYVNTTVAAYFVFLTSTSWGVEREHAKTGDILRLPAYPLHREEHVHTLASLYDEWVARPEQQKTVEREIEDVVSKAFSLDKIERTLVKDLAAFVLAPDSQRVTGPASTHELQSYAAAYSSVIERMVEKPKRISSTIRPTNGPLTVVSLRVSETSKKAPSSDIAPAKGDLATVLEHLDRQLKSAESKSIYVRRHVRFYDGETLHIVKPSDRIFWTESAAIADADETIAEAVSRKMLVAS
jgi:hypothetical protein